MIDDCFADDPTFIRQPQMLHCLCARGRRIMISTITTAQQFNAIHPIIRTSATALYMYSLRNTKDLGAFADEVSAALDKQTLLDLYHAATSQLCSFLFVKMPPKRELHAF